MGRRAPATRVREHAPVPITIPANGAIFVEDNAWVEGTLGDSTHHKRVTVVATNEADPGKTVFVGRNNLTYSSYDGEDILGLLGANNIEIIRYSQNNLRIDGALMAKNGRVGRDFYLLDLPNSITFFGSIISYGTIQCGKRHNSDLGCRLSARLSQFRQQSAL